MNNKLLIGIGVVAILVIGGFFIIGSKSSSPTTQPQQLETSPLASTTVKEGAQKITISGNEFSYDPPTATVKKGQPVELTFKNSGTFPHNLNIEGLGQQTKTINPGEEDTISFTPENAGTFSFKCTIDSHAEKGMVGTITVQ